MRDQHTEFHLIKPTRGLAPVPLHHITLSKLVEIRPLPAEQEKYVAAAIADETLFARAWPFNPLRKMLTIAEENGLLERAIPCGISGFVMATHYDEIDGPVVAVFDAGSGVLAGAAHWKNVIVRHPYQGRGIDTEILIKAFEIGVLHPKTMKEGNYLSEGGRSLHRKAHRTAVTRAVERGEEVRADVLQDYPDLVKREAKTTLMGTFVKRIRDTIGQETMEDAGVSQELEIDDPTNTAGHRMPRVHRPR
jgi:hypothetical protein